MTLSRRDYQALKRGADLADAQRLLNERDLPASAQAAPIVGALLGLLLFGLAISLVSSEREQVGQDRVAISDKLLSASETHAYRQ
jgi:hypothetical protein